MEGISTHRDALPVLQESITLDVFEASSPVLCHVVYDKGHVSLWCPWDEIALEMYTVRPD